MTKDRYEKFLKLLKENLEYVKRELGYYSITVDKIEINKVYEKLGEDYKTLDYEEHILMHTFFSEFSLIVDLILNKVLRSLAKLEQAKIESNRDLMIWAEKKGFVENYKILWNLKELRNRLAHEYLDLLKNKDIYYEVKEYIPLLYILFQKIENYVKNNFEKEKWKNC